MVPPNGMVRVRLLIMQANTGVHELPPSSSYAPDSKDGYTSQALEKAFARHPVARDSTTFPHGRLHVHGPLARSSTTPTRPRRGVATPTRLPTEPQERSMRTHAGGRPPWSHHRPPERRVSSPKRKAPHPRLTSFNTTRPRSEPRPLATRQTNGHFRRKSAIPLPRYRARVFLSSRTPLRIDYATSMGRPSPQTHQLKRELEWWRIVPIHNGRSIYKPIGTAYLHANSSGYGWRAVLNHNPKLQARGIWCFLTFGMT
jgi:hypothetical protein